MTALVKQHRVLWPYADHRVTFASIRGDEAVGVSPNSTSEKPDTFHVNVVTGVWHDKLRGEGGSLPAFLEWRQAQYQEAMTAAKLDALAERRRQPVEALETAGLGYDEHHDGYTILTHDAQGQACDLRRYADHKGTWQMRSTPGCVGGLLGVDALRAAPAGAKVYICEGEWDALALAHRLTLAKQKGIVVGTPGAGSFKKECVPLLAGKHVRVCFDHDEAGRKGAARLAAVLAPAAARVECLVWPAEKPDGYDVSNYCADTATDDARESLKALRRLLVDHTPTSTATTDGSNAADGSALGVLLRTFAFSIGTKQFVRLTDGFAYDKEQFNDLNGAQFPVTGASSASSLLLRAPELMRVQQPAYVPGVNERITQEVLNGTSVSVVNLWIPSKVVPKAGDVSPYLEHAEYLLPDARARQVCLDFAASVARNPSEKHNWAAMLCGKPGIGKDLFVWPLVQTLGPHNCATPTPDDLSGAFTDWLKGARLVVVDTLRFAGQRAQLSRMNQWIAAPPDYVRINTKFVPQFVIRNRVAFVFMANREDALPLDLDDRRFFVYASPAEPRKPSYYRPLWDWARDNTSALAHYLLHEHVLADSFDAKTPPPMTDAKRAMIRANESPLLSLLRQALDEVATPLRYELVTVREVQRHCETVGGLRGVTEHAVGSALRALGAEKLPRQLSLSAAQAKGQGGLRPHVWAVAEAETYRAMGRPALSEAFLRQRADKTYRRPVSVLRLAGKEGA
jgi:hypothetical protein